MQRFTHTLPATSLPPSRYVASRYGVSPSDLPYLDVPFLFPIPCPLCASPSFAPAPVSRFAPVRSYEDEGSDGRTDGEMSVSVVGGEEGVGDGEEEEGWKRGKEAGNEGGEKQWQQEREHDEKLSPGHSAAML